MENRFLLVLALLLAVSCGRKQCETLSEAAEGKFFIGATYSREMAGGGKDDELEVVRKEFSAVSCACFINNSIHPEKDRYDFDVADKFVGFCEKNGKYTVGHCLVWYYLVAPWFFVDDDGSDIDAETLKARMKDHISTVVGRYRGRVDAWDVVNEAFLASGKLRENRFWELLGEDYIPYAFRCAREADPDAELILNDFGIPRYKKRKAVIEFVNRMRAEGVPIDGIGIQGHWNETFPDPDSLEVAIRDIYSSTGLQVCITELDFSILPKVTDGANADERRKYTPERDPYRNGFPEDRVEWWNSRMEEYFRVFRDNADAIRRVTIWGLSDRDTWRNDWPIPGRTDYAVLFDRELREKPVVRWIKENY